MNPPTLQRLKPLPFSLDCALHPNLSTLRFCQEVQIAFVHTMPARLPSRQLKSPLARPATGREPIWMLVQGGQTQKRNAFCEVVKSFSRFRHQPDSLGFLGVDLPTSCSWTVVVQSAQ